MNIDDSVVRRFENKVNYAGKNECWEWIGCIGNHGYGETTVSRKKALTHRVSWSIYRGEIPAGMQILHHCDNPPCVNPRHLFLGTQSDNMKDMTIKGRRANGAKNGNSKINELDVVNIRMLGRTGRLKQKTIGKMYRLSSQQISHILAVRRWKHI